MELAEFLYLYSPLYAIFVFFLFAAYMNKRSRDREEERQRKLTPEQKENEWKAFQW